MNLNQKPLGIYIHVPFCKSKCAYCDFYSLPHAENRMDAYVRAVTAHLIETAPQAQEYLVDSVYFGGGTPTFLGEKRLREILKVVLKRYHVAGDAEITFEANPDTACDWKELRSLRRAGFNRISLGMQSACDEELREIGRIHTFAQVQQAVEAAQQAKFDNFSLDLIYGLPHQTQDRWAENLRAAVSLAPKHLSCYGLQVEEGTALYAHRQEAELPGDETQSEMYLYTVDCLHHYGYQQYEISNFARPGYESRHNLKYWLLEEYAGFGPGAHSDFGGVRYAYARDLDAYIDGVLNGKPILSENERIPPLDRDTEYLMLGLRTVRGIQPRTFENRYRRRFDCLVPFLKECEHAGYAVCMPDESWHLTPKGFLVSNRIIGGVLDALGEDKERRAQAEARRDYRVNPD
jgi:oxygen-independent coproporphyrinogen-3 oxidase